MKFLIFLVMFAANLYADECTEKIKISGMIQINRQSFGELCIVNIHPSYSSDLFYRSYMFTNDGMIMVFNSYGDGPPSKTTGAREIFLFPRKKIMPDFTVFEDGNISVLLPSGKSALFDHKTGNMVQLDGAEVKTLELSKDNEGGFEILNFDELRIDFGFRMGESPMNTTNRMVNIFDRHNNQCRLKNTEIVDYDGEDDAKIKFNDDQKLYLEVMELCPNLKI